MKNLKDKKMFSSIKNTLTIFNNQYKNFLDPFNKYMNKSTRQIFHAFTVKNQISKPLWYLEKQIKNQGNSMLKSMLESNARSFKNFGQKWI